MGAQAFLKSKIMDNIHKYFYLILYTGYIRQAGEAARNAVDEAAPLETDFDIITQTLLGSAITPPVIINDQVGLSRATTGCVIACLFKEFQITSSFEGLVETVPGMNLNLL